MRSGTLCEMSRAIPRGFTAVAIAPTAGMDCPLKLAVLVDSSGDEVGGRLVDLRTTADARVFLGCVLDAAGGVARWVEVWVQDSAGFAASPAGRRGTINNSVLDARWRSQATALSGLDGQGIIASGWEESHPPPMLVDAEAMRVVVPTVQGSGEPLALCTDDGLLTEVGLEAYSTSRSRYLYAPALGLESPFVPIGDESPERGPTASLDAVCGEAALLSDLNLAGGLMMVRPWAPVSFDQYVEVLGGGSWEGFEHGRAPVPLELKAPREPIEDFEGSIFLGRHGRWGRLVEALHLKLRALGEAVEQVSLVTERAGSPLLNLSSESFRVHLPPARIGLPALWAARTDLVDAGEAIELRIESSDSSCFLRRDDAATSVYRPVLGQSVGAGRGSFRVRELFESGRALILEGTLTTQERIEPAGSDLVFLTLNLADRRVPVYARLESDRALAGGEWRVRSIEQRFDDVVASALRSAEGVTMEGVPFEVLPMLSSPYDLYALAVVGVRSLLVDQQTTVPVALDELQSLARQLALDFDAEVSLADRIGAVFESDGRWLGSLGPHRLVRESVEPDEALSVVPARVWYEVLALLVSMLPGIGPDSICRDLGDARRGGLGAIYDPVLEQIRLLLVRTRSLIVIDWKYNREISGVIRKYLAGLS